MTKKELKQLASQIKDLEAKIADLDKKRFELETQYLSAISGVAVDDVIEWKAGNRTWRGRVIRLIDGGCGDVEFRVRVIRKDGTEGDRVRVYSFQNPKRVG